MSYPILVCLTVLAASLPVATQEPPCIYVIFDASGSMWGALADGARKIETARQVLRDFSGGDFSGKQLAMRVYGHRRKGDCSDSELVIPFSEPEDFAKQMNLVLPKINPKGKTPISHSLEQALADMGDREGEIILISDGIETCDADPCALVRAWAEKEIRIRVHVVGFGVDEKARIALECIAQAAGTSYHDADNADQLADGLAHIQRETTWSAVTLQGSDAEGNRVSIEGTLSSVGELVGPVASHVGHRYEEGGYELLAGVRTRNGSLYEPVRKQITVKAAGRTLIPVQVVLPPRVRAVFSLDGQEQRGSAVSVERGGKELFKFRYRDTVFMEPGSYLFRASPNKENKLSVAVEISEGLNEVRFEMIKTVQVIFRMLASGSKHHFGGNLELWQDGERRYKVHRNNGARVLPGTYELRMLSGLTSYAVAGRVINGEAKQEYEVIVPVGHVTVIYQDVDGKREKDKRCFIGLGEKGKGKYHGGGKQIPLRPGTYNLSGWRGNYERLVFEVVEGVSSELVLRARE